MKYQNIQVTGTIDYDSKTIPDYLMKVYKNLEFDNIFNNYKHY